MEIVAGIALICGLISMPYYDFRPLEENYDSFAEIWYGPKPSYGS